MRQRLRTLRKIASLYSVMEEMRWSELERAAGEVREVEEAAAMQRSIVLSARLDEREALAGGDRLGWMTADKRREIAGRKSLRLEEIRVERESASEAARQRYLVSRIESEQMTRVRDDVAQTAELDASRREQVVLDDRYASRKRWLEAQCDARMRES